MTELTKNVIASLISAIVIALIFSLWNDFVYRKDSLSGYWKVEYKTQQSSYKKYIGLKTFYEFIVGQNGNSLHGTGEKIAEELSGHHFEYKNSDRIQLDFEGSITYKAFSENRVDIVFKEHGANRQSSTVLSMKIISEDKMVGTYISSNASSQGTVIFTRVDQAF